MIIYQFKDGYRYNSDTIMLYHFTKDLKPKGKILEVGAGSGVLGLLLARDLKDSNVTLLDIQKENINLCIKNSKVNNIECEIIEADYKSFKSNERFDLIVSNPPYYHDGVRKSENEHLSISRYSSNLSLENLIKNSSSHLKSHGSLVFCYDAKQLMYISHLLLENKFSMTKLKFIYPKKGKSAKVVLAEAKKSSKSLCNVMESIYLSDDSGYSKEAYRIFKEANLESVDV
ncbi:tRNA m6A37 methyltransferase [Campylobacter blaseri]|uniref:Methyltransferase n=1 Tax=Campylobacter blaseri TaxID=2042961 RepID=A0A2P8QYJ0_9BACT|nr:methyltransferase [Campylobacter blaseri]PSM51280.1 methyltransferase [Campylobacter blaseri]PSM52424.1 methyltransferase [Campylobacter blaseri]QKF86247.1 tRNA m6A37 methyltransferase [Campylobacter blaseri]